MGVRWEFLLGERIACRLDEHGGEKERIHAELYARLNLELFCEVEAVVRRLVAKPEYAEIIAWVDSPEAPES